MKQLINDKLCIAGAIGSGREMVAKILSDLTGLPIIEWDTVEENEPENIRGIVFDVASDERCDEARLKDFTVIQYRNESCDKSVRITEEDDDIQVAYKMSDTPACMYINLVKIFESQLLGE